MFLCRQFNNKANNRAKLIRNNKIKRNTKKYNNCRKKNKTDMTLKKERNNNKKQILFSMSNVQCEIPTIIY